MNNIIREPDGYRFEEALECAKQESAYWGESLRLAIAERMVRALDEQNITRSELAGRMGVSAAYITKMLRGHANLTLNSLAKMAFALDLKWEFILLTKEASLEPYVRRDEEGMSTIHVAEAETIEGRGQPLVVQQDEYGRKRPLGTRYKKRKIAEKPKTDRALPKRKRKRTAQRS